ncbi:MAG TPA: hypothetical protein VGR95_04970 [Thermoanaerobaculia bacterium]|jgi:hypothetical protein|nr:hypothetical protein [Thermoanaerobaculia bacterium]
MNVYIPLILVALGSISNSSQSAKVNDVGASLQAAATATLCKKAGEFCVNRQPSNGWCMAQEATERAQYGPNLSGPFPTKKEATREMCKLLDPTSPDTTKCSDVLPKDACK